MADKLTAKQKLFCENYVSNGYKLQKAYMDAFGASPEVANANQWKLMKKDAIKNYIREVQHERFEALHITADSIASQLRDIAMSEDASYMERMRALELIQKQMGLQTQRVDAKVEVNNITVDIEEE